LDLFDRVDQKPSRRIDELRRLFIASENGDYRQNKEGNEDMGDRDHIAAS